MAPSLFRTTDFETLHDDCLTRRGLQGSYYPEELSTCRCPSAAPLSTCYDMNDLVTITVQQEDSASKSFRLPRKLLIWHSSYFAAALDPNGNFVSSGADEMSIYDQINVFDTFVCWMYAGRLADPPAEKKAAKGAKRNRRDERDMVAYRDMDFIMFVDIWIFADLRGIPPLKNAAIDALHYKFARPWRSYPDSRAVERVLANTMDSSRLRALFVDMYVHTKEHSWWASVDKDEFDDEFFALLQARYKDTLRLTRRYPQEGLLRDYDAERAVFARLYPTERDWMTALDRCKYHDHSGPGGRLRLASRK